MTDLEKTSISNLSKQISDIQNSLMTINTTQERLSRYVDSHKKESSELSENVSNLGREVSALSSALELAQSDLKTWAESSFATLKQFGDMEKTLSEIKNEMSRISELDTSVNELIRDVEGCLDEIDTIKQQLELINSQLEAIQKEIDEIIGSIQSIVVVPDFSDGSVRIRNIEASPIRFEVQPLIAAKKVAEVGPSVFSVDFVKTQTKGSLNNIPVSKVSFDGEFVTVEVDGTKLPADVKEGQCSANARLLVEDGIIHRTSEYFSVAYEYESCISLDVQNITQSSAVLYGMVSSIGEPFEIGFYVSMNNTPTADNGIAVIAEEETAARFRGYVSNLLSENTYYYRAFCRKGNKELLGEINKFTTTEYPSIDLGLSVDWGTCNLGARAPEEFGDYYAWGETTSKTVFSEQEYEGNSMATWFLSSTEDVASKRMGSNWRIPTKDEIVELLEHSRVTWVEDYNGTGVSGYDVEVYQKNGNIYSQQGSGKHLFFPDSGYKEKEHLMYETLLWSSVKEWSDGAFCASFIHEGSNAWKNISTSSLFRGLAIRPVRGTARKDVSGIELSTKSISLMVGEKATIDVSIIPSDAYSQEYTYNIDEPIVDVLYRNESGGITLQATNIGHCKISFWPIHAVEKIAQCEVSVSDGDANAPELVDMGLSVKWAKKNIGAVSPQSQGFLVRWGEVDYYKFDESDYKWYNGDKLSGYNTDSRYGIVDNRGILSTEDDIVSVKYGQDWHIPTLTEWEELQANSTATWLDNFEGTGVSGYLFKSTVGGYENASIFIPENTYWTPFRSESPLFAICEQLSVYGITVGDMNMDASCVIRPVCGRRVINHPEAVIVKPSTISLTVDSEIIPSITLSPSDVSLKRMIMSVEDNSIVNLDNDLIVVPKKTGSTVIRATSVDGGVTCEIPITISARQYNDDYVDLGLDVLWASCNLGARTPTESGGFYSWGELTPKHGYEQFKNHAYRYWDSTSESYSKYSGTESSMMIEDDPARKALGNSWRVPSYHEFSQLVGSCDWTFIEDYQSTGVSGYLVTSRINENTIFIPDSGGYEAGRALDGVYIWTNTLYTNNDPTFGPMARALHCGVDTKHSPKSGHMPLYLGFSIRPVREK